MTAYTPAGVTGFKAQAKTVCYHDANLLCVLSAALALVRPKNKTKTKTKPKQNKTKNKNPERFQVK